VARAIQLSEQRYCGAGAMLGKVAHLTHTFRLIETDRAVAASETHVPAQIAHTDTDVALYSN